MDNPRRWPIVAATVVFIALGIGVAWGLRGKFSAKPLVLPAPPPSIPVLVEVPVATNEIPRNDKTNRTERTDEAATAGLTSRVQVAISPAVPLAKDAEGLLEAGRKDKAREQFLSALAANPEDSLRVRIEDQLGLLNVELIRHPWPMPEKQDVVVQEGDSVKAIARKFGTTVDLIVKGNELKRPDVIRPGQHLKVFSGKMEIRVSKARNDLLLTAGGRFFKRYRVGTGRYDKTPVGSFVVTERISEPPWWRDDGRTVPFGDKENILGTRWMAIKATGTTPEIKGYGIHGTWDTNSIGKAESAGCIRLKNEDVEELFELIPIGTPVVIEE